MSKIKPIGLKGAGSHQFGTPTTFDLIFYNDGLASQTAVVVLKNELGVEVFQSESVVASKVIITINGLMADLQWKIEVSGVDVNFNTLICKLQETSTFGNTYTTNTILHTADGVANSFTLPDNKPANNAHELIVSVDGVIAPQTAWDLDPTKTLCVFGSALASGLELELKLHKQE